MAPLFRHLEIFGNLCLPQGLSRQARSRKIRVEETPQGVVMAMVYCQGCATNPETGLGFDRVGISWKSHDGIRQRKDVVLLGISYSALIRPAIS
jgi:hypothetical protein